MTPNNSKVDAVMAGPESPAETAPSDAAVTDERPTEHWNHAQLDAYAVEHGVDLTGASTKAEKLAAIAGSDPIE